MYKARHKQTDRDVALKRALQSQDARQRIRREIEVQLTLAPHPNIMPILDHDPGFTWYTMPIAQGTIDNLRSKIDEEALAVLVVDLAQALDYAHGRDLVHRDISPGNILAFDGSKSGALRWVVADWGMVKRPYNSDSPRLTHTGQRMGTRGFDAPELDDDPRTATAATDVYSLGRIVAWVLTGQDPKPGRPLLPDGPYLHWRSFVKACTEQDVQHRLGTMDDLQLALRNVFTDQFELPTVRAQRALDGLLSGDPAKWDDLVTLALTHMNDSELFLDKLVRVPTPQIRQWAVGATSDAADLAQATVRHLMSSAWGQRDRKYAGTPLGFVFAILQTLMECGDVGNAHDVAEQFLSADEHWAHPRQRDRTIEWLADLDAHDATVIARILATRPHLISYYRSDIPLLSPELRAVFQIG